MKKIIIALVILIMLIGSLFVLTGCEKNQGGKETQKEDEKAKVELETAEVIYTYPWDTQIWKNYKVTVGYPKNDNWGVQDNSSNEKELVLNDETRKVEIKFKVTQESKATWDQNSEQRKKSMNGSDNKWGEFTGICYTIADNTYIGWVVLGNPTSIESGKIGTHVNKLEFEIKSKGGSELSIDELRKIMDEDILANISWEEID